MIGLAITGIVVVMIAILVLEGQGPLTRPISAREGEGRCRDRADPITVTARKRRSGGRARRCLGGRRRRGVCRSRPAASLKNRRHEAVVDQRRAVPVARLRRRRTRPRRHGEGRGGYGAPGTADGAGSSRSTE